MDADLEIKAYYAGHVLGAAMFQVKVRHQSIVYTVSMSITMATLTMTTYTGRL